jgi:phosphoenolpyruvate carboxykinase (ATP)
MVLHPSRYAELLADKIREHGADCWLVNTGWSGGPYGVGKRMAIKHTRSMLKAALEGKLREVKYEKDPVFGLNIPASCEGIPHEILHPRNTWKDPAAYDEKARVLAGLFHKNFAQFADEVKQEVRDAGPLVR